jgi:flagellar hook assembly protein FlgD
MKFTVSQNVNWVSFKIENRNDLTKFKTLQSGVNCVDGTTTCAKVWDGALSSGGLLTDGTYRIKVHIKDLAGNEYNDYLPSGITVVQ